MRRNFWLMFILLFTMSFAVVSCSDDKDDEIDNPTPNPNPDPDEDEPTWEDLITTYSSQSDNLTIGGVTASEGKTIKLATSGKDQVVDITFTNLIPERASLIITGVELTKNSSNKFSFVAEEEVSGTEITVTGSLSFDSEDNPQLNIVVVRNIESAIVNQWHLNPAGLISFDVYPADNALMFTMISMVINPMITKEVQDVVIDFTKNGSVEIEWTDIEGVESNIYKAIAVLIPGGFLDETVIRSLVNIEYFIDEQNGTVTLAIDKSILNLLDQFGDLLGDFDIASIIALMDDLGGYYGLSLDVEIDGNDVKFIANTELVAKILPIVSMLIADVDIPEEYEFIIEYLGELAGWIEEGVLIQRLNIELNFVAE
ncbi:MAG: hypothetical protein LUF90_00345 [Rikenellaceae bacterium]|nr:hypothetical protein [Rikenellaceae bacterium]